MEAFRFYSWYWLACIPIAIAFTAWSLRKRTQPHVLFSSIESFKAMPIGAMQRIKALLPWLQLLGFVLLLVGLARPQSGKSESRISGQGIAIELVLDVSGSMEALDFELKGKEVNRLTAVKHVVREFVVGSRASGLSGRRDDQVGIVAFGGFADSKCPLTLDHGALVDIVDSLQIPKAIRDRRGRVINEEALQEELATAIGDGLALGIDRLKNATAKSKVVVLLTDGDSNAGAVEPLDAAQIAKELGIKVYTIGIGRNGVVPVPREDNFGGTILVPAQFKIDEQLLQEIADVTGGVYFNASDLKGLSDVYAKIDQLEKSELEETKFSQYSELYPWFVSIGLALLGAVHLLRQTRFRTLT